MSCDVTRYVTRDKGRDVRRESRDLHRTAPHRTNSSLVAVVCERSEGIHPSLRSVRRRSATMDGAAPQPIGGR